MRAAVIGCGSIAPTHVEAIFKAGVSIAALCDTDTSKAQKLARDFSLEKCAVYGDYAELLEKEKPDCVHICTPHYLHAPMTVAALRKNINVFVEKPMAISLEEIAEVKAAAKKSNAKVGVCFQNRYLELNQKVKELCADNGTTAAFISVVWSRDKKYYEEAPWRGDKKKSGGGVLMNQAIHTFDLLQWFLGETPRSVTAHTANYHLNGVIGVEDTAEGYLEFGTAAASFYATTASPDNSPVTVRLGGKRKIEISGNTLTIDGSAETAAAKKTTAAKDYWGYGHEKIIADFYKCVGGKIPFPVDENEGAKAVETLLRIYKSEGRRT